jgi:hypothetical protein
VREEGDSKRRNTIQITRTAQPHRTAASEEMEDGREEVVGAEQERDHRQTEHGTPRDGNGTDTDKKDYEGGNSSSYLDIGRR